MTPYQPAGELSNLREVIYSTSTLTDVNSGKDRSKLGKEGKKKKKKRKKHTPLIVSLLAAPFDLHYIFSFTGKGFPLFEGADMVYWYGKGERFSRTCYFSLVRNAVLASLLPATPPLTCAPSLALAVFFSVVAFVFFFFLKFQELGKEEKKKSGREGKKEKKNCWLSFLLFSFSFVSLARGTSARLYF
eukprot:TRINITY_DN1591_c1_g1_i6.p1 TRINITY_DN1591_c1_g1~~TRINITY_DN1591_c1_g1_i6.p1  ORF type:complete len:188 (+),score=4.17 TRINITY_DN1591_c1_g1_i6:189-752(+)